MSAVLLVALAAACAPGAHPVHDQAAACTAFAVGAFAEWTPEDLTSCPPPTYGGAMAPMTIAGQPVVILFGGSTLGPTDADVNAASSDTWMWNGTSWTLLHPSVSPPALTDAHLVADPVHGNLVLFGGTNELAQANSRTFTFDGTAWTDHTDYADLRTSAHTPPARYHSTMAGDVVNGGVLLFGGQLESATEPVDDLWLWNGLSWTELAAPSAAGTCDPSAKPCPRDAAAMAPDPGTGGVVLFGGQVSVADPPLSDTWVWNGVAWSKKTPSTVPGARVDASFAQFDSSTDVLLGGDPEFSGDDAWSWDGTDWTQLPMSPAPRVKAAMAVLGPVGARPATMVVFGGSSTHVELNEHALPESFVVYDDTWSYDPTSVSPPPPPASGDWLLLQAQGPGSITQPSARREAAMASYVDLSGHVQGVLFGGIDSSGTTLNDTWIWDNTAWHQAVLAGSSPPARASATMAFNGVNDTVVLFGGRGVAGDLSDTWVFDGTTWTQVASCTPACAPAARRQAAMTDDPLDNGVLLFGGTATGAGTFGDTWLWNGTSWTQKATSGPLSRSQAVMGLNPADFGTVLFGGNHSGTILADTWTWDGSAWTQRTTPTAPSARYESVMGSLDPAAILFGGQPATGTTPLADTWAWDGTSWSLLNTTTSPPGRSSAVAAFAQTSATDLTVNVLLFGGTDGTNPMNDTWRFKQ